VRWLSTALAVLAHWWPVVVTLSFAVAGALILLGSAGLLVGGSVIPMGLGVVSWLAGFAGVTLGLVHQCFDCQRCRWRDHRAFCSGPDA
jgi:hypothetical protein